MSDQVRAIASVTAPVLLFSVGRSDLSAQSRAAQAWFQPPSPHNDRQMTTSRAESVHSQYGRRRSNTAQSVARALPPPPPPAPPLKYGSSKVLHAWVHEVKDSPNITLNHGHWPGVAEGDLLRITTADTREGFLFNVSRDEVQSRGQLQVCVMLRCVSGA